MRRSTDAKDPNTNEYKDRNNLILPIALAVLVILLIGTVVLAVTGVIGGGRNEPVSLSTPTSEPASTPNSSENGMIETVSEDASNLMDEDYILPDSSTKYLTIEDISHLSHEDLCLARNEIFARHGRIFKTREIADYFSSMSWYNGTVPADRFDSNVLSDIEKANVKLIQKYEDEHYGGSFY